MPAVDQSLRKVMKSPPGKRNDPIDGQSQSPPRTGLVSRTGAIRAALAPYGRAHRGRFWLGTCFALLLVAVRVAMPWPLQMLIKPWLAGEQLPASGLFAGHPALAVGLIYAALLTILGFADYRLRLNFARFAIGVVRDVRAGIFKHIAKLRRLDPHRSAGDFVTRMVGDSARLKAGLKGFLVHVATNGLLFLGISGVLFWMEWRVGMIFFSASVVTVLVTAFGASRIFVRAIRYRRKESDIADTITARLAIHEDDDDDEDLNDESEGANRESGQYEATLTRLQGLTTWSAHLILAVAVPLALWQGYAAVAAGRMDPSGLFVVMLYALMILGPMVRLSRQGARCGKILANADRLKDLLPEANPESGDAPLVGPLTEGIVLEGVRVNSREGGVKTRRLGPASFEFRAGEKVAVMAPPGAGKSTLLSLLAGRQSYTGSVRWDRREMRELSYDALSDHIAYVAQVPHWPTMDVDEIAEARRDAPPGDPIAGLLRGRQFRPLRSRLANQPGGKLLAESVSHAERKLLALVRCRTSDHSLKLIDDPAGEMKKKKQAERLLSAFMAAQRADQTVIVTLHRPIALEQFDRVLVLRKKGRVDFDGTPGQWREWRRGGPAGSSGSPDTNTDTDTETPIKS